MKKYSKAGLLIVTLVIPALVFTFLRFFATNHYNVPYYFPLTNENGKAVMNKNDTAFYAIEGLNVKKLNGSDLSPNPFIGKLTVVHYQPGICDDTCQIVLSNLERIYNLREKNSLLNLLTICDTIPENLKSTPAFSDKDGWLISKVAEADLNHVFNTTLKFQTKVPGAKTNSIKSKLMLIDEDAHIRGYYNGYDPEEINRLMAEIKILNFEKETGSQD